MTESQLLTDVLKWLKIRRVVYWRNTSTPVPGRTYKGRRGVADILGICPGSFGRLLALELKARKGDTSDDQKKWLAEVASAGAMTLVVRDIADLENLWKEMGW